MQTASQLLQASFTAIQASWLMHLVSVVVSSSFYVIEYIDSLALLGLKLSFCFCKRNGKNIIAELLL